MTTPIIIEIDNIIREMKSLEIYNDFMNMLNIFSNNEDYKDRKASFFYELDLSGFYFGDFKYHLFNIFKNKLERFKLDQYDYANALNFITTSKVSNFEKKFLVKELHLSLFRINFRFLHGLTPKEIIDVIKTTENIFNINKIDEIIALKDVLRDKK